MLSDSIKRRRVSKAFIDAAFEIIEKDGVAAITNRGVAEIAGYNSATIYNYFENLDHLVFMASMRFIKRYSTHLLKKLEKIDDPLERLFIIWDVFCDYSFARPDVYKSIFFSSISTDLDICFKDYYLLYPEDLVSTKNQTLSVMFGEYNIYKRGKSILQDCIEKGIFRPEDIDQLSDRIYIIYEGMLFRVIRGRTTKEEAKATFNLYFNHLITSYRQDILPSCKDC